MGKNKNKAKTDSEQSMQLPAQYANLPPEYQQQLMAQLNSVPTKQEIERRSRIYFANMKRANQQVSKSDIAQVQSWFSDNWFGELTKKVRETYIFSQDQTATVAIQRIIPVEQVIKILELGTKLLSNSLNVENIIVPGTPITELQGDLPKQYKDKLPADFGLQSLQSMKPVELQYNTPQIPKHPHLIIVGDTHGTFEVLENVFAKEGLPADDIVYLFNGDYVDRGSFSIEIFISLLVFKLLNNKCMYMLRGNHETASVSSMYSLQEEVKRKYPDHHEQIFQLFVKCFQALPIAARINDSYYVVHGGISGWPGFDIDMINTLNRFRDPESQQSSHYQSFDPLSDVLWSDPSEDLEKIRFNQTRGTAIQFGKTAIKAFLKSSKMQFLIRSHTCVPEGYQLMHDAHTMTLFSVPNYNEKNLGAYCVLYGLYDAEKQPNDLQRRSLKDCSAKALYEIEPAVPLCFIRQFNCSDHAKIINQPIIREMQERQMQAQQAQIFEMLRRQGAM
ncbi:Serine/threonine_protein phosphatase 5 [Hexamita inflata]|uniref:Serine/threonine-protein phosphatase n=1 Tax=Hexamita inflata TaxID=28002 RepID=A0AA86UKT1_9EUKA|nr:Serine/threonine protein phosphatase 5 [Hexamita inflata]